MERKSWPLNLDFYHLEGKVITRTIVLLIPMKAKTKHVTSKKDFVGVLPVVSFEG